MRFEGNEVVVESQDEQGVLPNRFPIDRIPDAIAELMPHLEEETQIMAAENVRRYGTPIPREGHEAAFTYRGIKLGMMFQFLRNAQERHGI